MAKPLQYKRTPVHGENFTLWNVVQSSTNSLQFGKTPVEGECIGPWDSQEEMSTPSTGELQYFKYRAIFCKIFGLCSQGVMYRHVPKKFQYS
jgi:hypothetical protein